MKKTIITLTTTFLVITFLASCSPKNENTSKSRESSETENLKNVISSTTEESQSNDSSQQIEELKLSKEDIYGKKFKGNTTDPQTEITFTFANPNFDFEDGDVLSYYRNIIEPDYQYERTKGIQFENMTIAIDGNNYIVKSTSADGETVHIHTFKKIDDVTISWISEGKEIVLTENLEQ